MIRETIEINGITIYIEKKKIKNMYIRVLPNGFVKISAPLSLPQKNIIDFANSKMDWIIEKRENAIKNPPEYYLRYVTGETHYIWGKGYTLQLCTKEFSKKVYIDYEENIIYLPVEGVAIENSLEGIEAREKTLIEFYRKEIKKAIPPVLDKCIAIVGRSPNEWRVKNMKTRWGSCNVYQKRIWLNLQLAKKDPICLEYVIIHELTHLYEANHGVRFKNYMDNFCPNWREIKKLLNKM
ncbi:MAG: SprT family zinc-dependent metalloprotease [Methanobacteriaceae archaeon]|nr:SprT family zinc-dependent metalloprotease [Methanobacteriaceae archaeon]